MKLGLLLAFVLINSLSYCQITFEEITIPTDFNIEAVRQSPSGEYFIQTATDDESIYTSLNGTEWIKTSLPVSHHLDDIQFFSDGTPVLQGDYINLQTHMIRRNGNWFVLNIPGVGNVASSFIKKDTLFVFQHETFAYSLDKGESFSILFTCQESTNAQTAHLWKMANHFILHYTTGSYNHISIYNESGERTLNQTLSLLSVTPVYNNCGQVLLYALPQPNTYYLLSEPGLELQQGVTTDIIPSWSENTKIFSQDVQYYIRDKNTIYRSTGCNFDWEELAMDDLIEDNAYAWFGPHEDIFLYNEGSNHYIKRDTVSNLWISYYPEINHPHVFKAGESLQDDQFVLTSNFLFHKKIGDLLWDQTDSIGGLNYQTQYSPDGDLYLNRKSHLEYSNDNGASFSVIELPQGWAPEEYNYMHVLDNDIIFMSNRLSVDCYYTMNNGQDWILAGVSFPLSTPIVTLVDDYILAVELSQYFTASKINLANHEVAVDDLGDNFSLVLGATFAEDGTLYFQTYDFMLGNESLYRYQFGENVKFLGHFEELAHVLALEVIGSDLYGLSAGRYYVFDGESVKEYNYVDLPESTSGLSFSVSDNKYVYAILDHHRIFRSTKSTVHTEDPPISLEVKIYPNPASTSITVSTPESGQQKFDSYVLYDMLGCCVHQANACSGESICVSHLAPGMYTILLKENGVVIGMGKFISQ